MGRSPSDRVLRAWSPIAVVAAVACAATACNDGETAPLPAPIPASGAAIEPIEPIEPLRNAPLPTLTPTYDGSGQAVEPTVLHFAQAWRGHPYWMVMSPYPHGDAAFENPSILVSQDGLKWRVPGGLENPLVLPRRGTLSDATLVHDDASNELWVYYLDDVKAGGVDTQSMHRVTSADGLHWTAPEPILTGHGYPIQSPSVIKVGDTFLMWTVDAGPDGCLTSATRVDRRDSHDGVHWTKPREVDITVPGHVIWHMNVIRVPETGHLLSLLSAYPQGTACSVGSLFLAEFDGSRWETYDPAVLVPGHGWDNQEIYRSSLLYDPLTTKLRVWYSARQLETDTWHVGYTEGLRPLR